MQSILEFFKNITWSTALITALELVVTFLVTTVVVPNIAKIISGTGALFDGLKSKAGTIKNQYAAGVLSRLVIIVRDVVLMMENTEIEQLKEAAKDGKITKDEMLASLKAVKDKALAKIKEHANLQDIWKLGTLLFTGNEADLEKWLADQLEVQVSLLPPSGLQTSADGTTPPAIAQAMKDVGAKTEPAPVQVTPVAPAAVTGNP